MGLLSYLRRLRGGDSVRRAPEPVVESEGDSGNVLLTVELEPDGNVFAHCYFPAVTDQGQYATVAGNTAKLLYLLNSGALLPVLQQSVVIGGAMSNQDALSRAILGQLNTMTAEKAKYEGRSEAGRKLVVRPTEVFKFPTTTERPTE